MQSGLEIPQLCVSHCLFMLKICCRYNGGDSYTFVFREVENYNWSRWDYKGELDHDQVKVVCIDKEILNLQITIYSVVCLIVKYVCY